MNNYPVLCVGIEDPDTCLKYADGYFIKHLEGERHGVCKGCIKNLSADAALQYYPDLQVILYDSKEHIKFLKSK